MLQWLGKLTSSQLSPSVQRRILELTPVKVLDRWCFSHPKFVIELFCHWISEKNPDLEERESFAERKSTALVAVAKKFSRLSAMGILSLLQQDENLWKFYMPPPIGFIPMKSLPYILLEMTFELGGQDGRKKVLEVVQKSRQTLGGRKQGDILENFKTDTVIEIFESMPEFDVRMRLMMNSPEAVAFWLDHWDWKMKNMEKSEKSAYWLGKLPGERAFKIEMLLKQLEFRRKFEPIRSIHDERIEWEEYQKSLKE